VCGRTDLFEETSNILTGCILKIHEKSCDINKPSE
jgi:hypothetical protein